MCKNDTKIYIYYFFTIPYLDAKNSNQDSIHENKDPQKKKKKQK